MKKKTHNFNFFMLIIFLLTLIQKIQLFRNNIYIFTLQLNIHIFMFLHFYIKSFNKILIKIFFCKREILTFYYLQKLT